MDSSFYDDKNAPGAGRKYIPKNKSENIDYKARGRQNKFGTANATNFVIKKLHNFGSSLYNMKDKIVEVTPNANWDIVNGLVKSTFFNAYDASKGSYSQSWLFPSIQNLRFGESKTNWNYRV